LSRGDKFLSLAAVVEEEAMIRSILKKSRLEPMSRRSEVVGLFAGAPGKVEGALVTVNKLVEIITVLVHPHGKGKGSPAASLVDKELAGLEVWFIAVGEVAIGPDDRRNPFLAVARGKVRPE